MRSTIFILLLLLPMMATSQVLVVEENGDTTTKWEELFSLRDEYGGRFAQHKFIKSDGRYYLQLRFYSKKTEASLNENSSLTFSMIMHKGDIVLTHPKMSQGKDKTLFLAAFPITIAQLDQIIQSKMSHLSLVTAVNTMEYDFDNRMNYDLRSNAMAIVTGRDIRDGKVRIVVK